MSGKDMKIINIIDTISNQKNKKPSYQPQKSKQNLIKFCWKHRLVSVWKILDRDTQLSSAKTSQPAITYSKLTIETLEQGVKYVYEV